MSKIKIFDSTLRDGSHGVRHQLTKSQISGYCKRAEAAGIPVVYVGHGNGLGASSIHLDPSLLTDKEMLLAARKHLNKTKLGAFLIPGFGTIKDDIEPIIDLIDVLQVGTHCTEANITRQHIEYAKSKGKEVYGALMMSHMLDEWALADQAYLMQQYGADGVFIMDSAGASMPSDVKTKVSAMTWIYPKAEDLISVSKIQVPVGYHPHNNLALAIPNAVAAVEAGATMIDGTTRGLGAGAGNCPLEVLVAVLDKMGYDTGIDLYKMLDVAEFVASFAPPQEITSESIISGLSGVFSGFKPHVERASKRFKVNSWDIWLELGKQQVVAGQEDKVIEVASKLRHTSRMEALS